MYGYTITGYFHMWTKYGVPPEQLEVDDLHAFGSVDMNDLEAEWAKFNAALELMKHRIMMGYVRYGPLGSDESKSYDGVASIMKRIAMFREDGNGEHLIDIANIALVEFTNGKYAHFTGVDDGYHSPKEA